MFINPVNLADGTREPSTSEWSRNAVGTAATIDVGLVLTTLRRRRLLIGLTAAVFLVFGVAFLMLSPPRYQATAELIIDPLGLQVVKNEISPNPQTADANVATVENEMRVIGSSSLLSEVITSENLDSDPEFIGRPSILSGLTGFVRSALAGGASIPTAHPELTALQTLKKHLAVTRAERSFAVDVTVWTNDPSKSARLANAIVNTYMAHSVVARAQLARRGSASLVARLGELRQQVNDAENRVETYKRDHNLIDAEGHLVTNQQLAEVNTRLTDAKTTTAAAQAKLQQFETLKVGAQGGISEAIDSPTLAQLRAQAAEVDRRRAVLAMTLGPHHPALMAADAELKGIDAAIRDELGRIGASLQANYDRALDSERTLQRTFDQLSIKSTETSQALVKLRELEREALANRTVYESFLARSRELGEQTTVDTTNIRLISAATTPLAKSNLPARLILPVFLMLGLLVGAGGALAPVAFGAGRGATPRPT